MPWHGNAHLHPGGADSRKDAGEGVCRRLRLGLAAGQAVFKIEQGLAHLRQQDGDPPQGQASTQAYVRRQTMS